MATVKIICERGETEEEVQDLLLKSLSAHADGEIHREDFHQAVARDVVARLINDHDHMWQTILREVNKVLDEEVA